MISRFWNRSRGPLAVFGLLCLITVPAIIAFDIESTSEVATTRRITYSDFLANVSHNQVRFVNMNATMLSGKLADGTQFNTRIPQNLELAATLAAKSIMVDSIPDEQPSNPVVHMLAAWFPIMLYFLGMWLLIARPLKRLADIGERGLPPSDDRRINGVD